jgi:mono/diheme cytochrome c family protein
MAARGWRFRRGHVVTAVVVIVVLAAAAGAVSRQSAIDDLNSKNDTVAAHKVQAIRQRDALQAALDATAVQKARDEAAARSIEAQRPPGATLFAANCSACHGVDGEGGMGPQLLRGAVASHLSEGEELSVVTNGRAGMPAWSGALSPEQIQQVVAYTRTH